VKHQNIRKGEQSDSHET